MKEKEYYQAPCIEVLDIKNLSLLKEFSIEEIDFYGDGENFEYEEP